MNKKVGKQLAEDLMKYAKIDDDGNITMDDGIQKSIIGKIREKKPEDHTEEELKQLLGKTYEDIIEVLKEYTDLKEDYYSMIAVWIIGTYFHDSFSTYPFLFLNAMRGSGKTRTLKLIMSMAQRGEILTNVTEAVLFRYPKGNSLGIDEFEGLMRKGNEAIRELLNASYKKGNKVRRMKQKKTPEGTEQVVEEFEPYKPICLANIWGMEEVLGDRCITLILEKSSKPDIMRILEDFDTKPQIKIIRMALSEVLVSLCSYFSVEGYIEAWNKYVKQKYTTLYTQTTLTTHTTQTTPDNLLEMFNKIDEIGINGRNLELFFPMMLIAKMIGEDVFKCILGVANTLNKEKRKEEMMESKDVSLIDYVSQLEQTINYRSIRHITIGFRDFIGRVDDQDDKWLNEKWVGRALKRLELIIDKRRVAHGNEVTLNIDKAKQKIMGFK